jgi:hypothetical protein
VSTSRCDTGAIRCRKKNPGSAAIVAHATKKVGYPSRSTRRPLGSPATQRPSPNSEESSANCVALYRLSHTRRSSAPCAAAAIPCAPYSLAIATYVQARVAAVSAGSVAHCATSRGTARESAAPE